MKNWKKAYSIVLFVLSFALLNACSNNQPVVKEDKAPTVNQSATKDDKSSAVNQPTAKDDKAATVSQPTVKDDKATTASTIPGNEVFQKSCVACHSTGDITGGKIKIDSDKVHTDFKTQEDLLAFVSTKMPKKAPGSLSQEEYTAVVKYLWDQK